MSDVAIDACCLLNLIAAGNILPKKEDAIAMSMTFPYVLHVPDVVEGEALYVYQPDEDHAGMLVRSPLDIRGLVDACILHGCTLQRGDESNLFVQLAVRLDDGEAACLAIAKNRSWVMATDDRIARRLSGELNVATLGTAELVKSWAEATNASDEKIRISLKNIQQFARFVPRARSPESRWWFQFVE